MKSTTAAQPGLTFLKSRVQRKEPKGPLNFTGTTVMQWSV